MHRATLDLLRCPRCLAGSLVPEAPVTEKAMIFGPVRCLGCASRYPVHEGLVDFVADRHKPSPLQQAMELPWVARSWERYVRPAFSAVLTQGRLDRDSEYAVMHNFAGRPQGPVVDLGCGSGAFTRKLVRDFEACHVVGIDVSRPMIEEALAQIREHGLSADFVRTEVPPLPFGDACVGAIVASGMVHFVSALGTLMLEVARVLKPGGRFVASTFDTLHGARGVHQAGLYPRTNDELRRAAEAAGLVNYERVKVGPVLVFKAERP